MDIRIGDNNITFTGYNHPLKKAFKKGLLPNVRHGLYGYPINKDNVSLEHGVPVSLGGHTESSNLFLAERDANSRRGIRPLEEVITKKMMTDYLVQFIGIKNYLVDGQKYIDGIMQRWWSKLR